MARLPAPDELRALARLDAERVLVVEQLTVLRRGLQETLDASADSNADDEHDPEGATIAFERSQLETLIRLGERHLADIEEARARVTGGRYGARAACGQPISAARLEARPTAATCVACAPLTK